MVKIGIISDTHDNIETAKKAVQYFNSINIDYCLHAGDIIAPFMANLVFNDLKCKGNLILVQGNNDGEITGNKLNFTKIGSNFAGNYYVGIIDNKNILMQHDIHPKILESIASSNKFDIIIHGHTHSSEKKNIGNTIILNPGECCGILSGKNTIAIIDTEKMDAKIITL